MTEPAADAAATAADAAGYRPLLFSIAYGMTGSVGDAEDLVQDTFLGLTRAGLAGTTVDNPKAYLTTTVTRLGINHLKSARVRRESYVGEWLPEPVVAFAERPDGPAEHAEVAERLSMAFLLMLEALSPAERAVFLLREAFGYGYPEVAAMTGRSEANCRQIFARARKHLAPAAPDAGPAPRRRAEGEELARRFFAATEGGDLEALLELLAPDVVFHGDGGGKARSVGRSVAGLQRVAQLLMFGFGRNRELGISRKPVLVNGRPGALWLDPRGRVAGVIALDIADGAIRAFHAVNNPDKLAHLGLPLSDLGLRPRR
ncbi:DNA-directed RNA polymerase sigma-70 factor [Kitasatospora xanthocidica]|uniref:RNA polymerase sigma factor SigJ n=1 Tax=Kitasatospora xanthocidica TaxID=83382 RepID=UPI001674E740|nr:RNA polymerase sigma factor SigJ [Kitasatospora xanthocidica]GHF82104.1 DNA-directed RNA polymerase sigma-70 factor [Kitasatospora xanthocidica]